MCVHGVQHTALNNGKSASSSLKSGLNGEIMTNTRDRWKTRRMMASWCVAAMVFQAFVLLPVCLYMILAAGSAGAADVISSVGTWAGSLNIALGAIIATYTHQATKDDMRERNASDV